MKIAVVGTGVSGLVAAHKLHPRHEITVFEADTRIGGHVNTVDVEIDSRSVAVDTGFIVYNDRNYPGFRALLDELAVETQPAEMSFSVGDPRSGLEFRGSNPNTIFAQRRNLANPSFLRLIADIARFNRAARRLVADEPRWHGSDRLAGGNRDAGTGADETLGDFVRRNRFSKSFVRQFLVPFGASVWSADPTTFLGFPVRAYARFMHNHGLLELARRPEWRTVRGGSRTYVDALTAAFSHRILLDTPVHKLVTRRSEGGSQVEVLTARGPDLFDRVIVATHSDQALRMLGDPSATERDVLGAIGYQRNTATLHTDDRMLPRNPRARASWNYRIADHAEAGDAEGGDAGTTVTYWMNRLQSLETSQPLLVTLNRSDEIDPGSRIAEFEYHHPVFDVRAMAAQRRHSEVQGSRGIFYAGAYWGYGFHEDGVQSALEVVRLLEARR